MNPLGKRSFNLRPRARIVKTFGEELISNDYVAIVELIKNSYDADARLVEVVFEAPLDKGHGSITIRDDGKGMSPDEVIHGWMEPASISKVVKRRSATGRPYLGQKGIGRFSTAKLADKLTLVTRKLESPEVEASFNWADYYDPQKYLDEVEGVWEAREPKMIEGSGTVLKMSGLCTSWDEARVEQLLIQLRRLVNPVAPPEDFSIKLAFPEGLEKYNGEVEHPEMLSHQDYAIKASLKEDGELTFEYILGSDVDTKDKVTKKMILKSGKSPTFGPAEFEFRVWDRDSLGQLAAEIGKSIQSVREDLNAISGISIYRDGFRVSPYGDGTNDWLRLDLRRVQTPTFRVSNNQIVGRISITDQGNPELKDQTNRQGIVESDAFRELQEVAIYLLSELETRRYRARRPKYDELKDSTFMKQKIDLASVRKIVQKNLPENVEVTEALDKKESEINKKLEELKDVVVRYRRLSTLGQLMDVVLHDAGNSLSRVSKGIEIIEQEMDDPEGSVEKIARNISHVKEGSRLLGELFRRLEPFGGRKRERAKVINIEAAIEDVFKIYESELQDSKIRFSISSTDHSTKISESDFKLIFVNLLNNSIYWLKKVDEEKREVDVNITTQSDSIVIDFKDTGPGVDGVDSPYIFDPYYSKKPDGTGLGLTIVGELILEYGGDLELIANEGSGANFRIHLPIRE